MYKGFWLAVALVVSSVVAQAQERVVHVYNWSDYIDPKALSDFTRETGIKVIYDTYDSNETLETKLLAGNTGYDIVVPGATFLSRQIKAGIYQKLDRARLPNAKGLWPDVMQRMAVYDPGNEHALPYMWYTTGIAYDVKKAQQRLPGRVIDSWDIVFQPETLKAFASCGVYFIDSPEDVLTSAMRWLKIDPNSRKAEDIKKAADAVLRVKPSIKKFHSSEYINALANGDICLALGWAGDSFQARNRAKEAGNGVEIDYVIPKEGSLMSMDALAIPKDAPHLTEAYAFLDYLLRPDVAARNSDAIQYANGVIASKPFMDKSVLENRAIYPAPDVMSRLFTVNANDLTTQRLITREWTRVKTGR